jgi:hypothetical protein
MTETMLNRTEALRQEALEALQQSEQFRAYKALDDAVAAMGGQRHMAVQSEATLNGAPIRQAVKRPEINPPARRRVSQAEAAEMVLKEKGRPMTSAELMAAVPEKGVTVGGDKPLMSFGSTLSRDPRFINYRRDGLYYWWLKAKPMPANTNEAPDLPLQQGSDASSVSSSQEGGDAHAATTA